MDIMCRSRSNTKDREHDSLPVWNRRKDKKGKKTTRTTKRTRKKKREKLGRHEGKTEGEVNTFTLAWRERKGRRYGKEGKGWGKAKINTSFLERKKGYLVARRSYAGKQ